MARDHVCQMDVDEKKAAATSEYEGDKYYFDIDIRRHFGLDKYTSDVIPFWKTETVEAMDAFRHKPGYSDGKRVPICACAAIPARSSVISVIIAAFTRDSSFIIVAG